MSDDEQLRLTDLYPCPACGGRGYREYGESGSAFVKCRVCDGSGSVGYDPDDESIGF